MSRFPYLLICAALLLECPLLALAQTGPQPDAGRVLRELSQPMAAPRPSPEISIKGPGHNEIVPGGARVALSQIVFDGNSVFPQDVLQKILGDTSLPLDMAGLNGLAERITAHYRASGYLFARAWLPPQALSQGILKINIVEGRWGIVAVTANDPDLRARLQEFLAPLKPDQVIQRQPLERSVLLLNDLPGINIVPTVRPGREVGTGDLDVRVERDARFSGDIGYDNEGNRYSGRNRAHLNLAANGLISAGDRLSFKGLYTDEHMWNGGLSYSLPMGSSGLRSNIGYAHTYYELGKDYAGLGAHGVADVASIGLSYPVVRSREFNLTVSGALERKWLIDKNGSVGSEDHKQSDTFPLALNFDLHDLLAGGGITYGTFSWSHGNLRLGANLKAVDMVSARTDGNFEKFNFDFARIQALAGNFSLYGRISMQWADQNLDSSEKFGLGGIYGVRAYPSGEAYGDTGWLARLELRYALRMADSANLNPYIFYDAGHIRINQNPWTSGSNDRSLAGAGVGLRIDYLRWNVDASLAWRTVGGLPQSDSAHSMPMTWVSVGYKL